MNKEIEKPPVEEKPPVLTFHAVRASHLIYKYGLEEAIVIAKRMVEETMRSMKFDK